MNVDLNSRVEISDLVEELMSLIDDSDIDNKEMKKDITKSLILSGLVNVGGIDVKKRKTLDKNN